MPIDPILIQQARSLSYIGARKGCHLALMAEVFAQMGPSSIARRLWRTRPQRPYLTMRQAALMCYGRKCANPADEWAFAQWPEENSPVDAVFRRTPENGEPQFEFVQLKEVVPHELNPNATLQEVLDNLQRRYRRADGITVAVNLNQTVTSDLAALRLPDLPGAALWLYGLTDKPNECFLVGDLFSPPPTLIEYPFPRPMAGDSPSRWNNLLDD